VLVGRQAVNRHGSGDPRQRGGAGMNSEYASENYQFLLNIIHWLDGILE